MGKEISYMNNGDNLC